MSTFEQEKAKQTKKDYAYQFYLNKGLSSKDAAAIVGNLYAESGLDTTVKGTADDRGSVGIAQWHSERKRGLYNFARSQGKDWGDLDTQLNYVLKEGQTTHKDAFSKMLNTKTVQEATMAFMEHYERPAEWAKKQSWGVRSKTALGLSGVEADPNFTGYTENTGPTFDPGEDVTMQGSRIQLGTSTADVQEEPKEVAEAKNSIDEKSHVQELYNAIVQQQEQINNLQKSQQPSKEEQIQEEFSSDDMKDPYNYIDFTPEDTSQYTQQGFTEQLEEGGVIKDNSGYWNPNNWGKEVEISSPNITMEGVFEPLLGISKETGESKVMLPGNKYTFQNTKNVIEKPIKKYKRFK